MATPERSRPHDDVPADLLPVLRKAGILPEKQIEEIRQRILDGRYPIGTRELASRLVQDKILTDYQAKRLLTNRPGGLLVGRYVVMDRIGSGSMGRVYRAHHQLMDRAVAIKVIAPEIVTKGRIVSRFQREMKLVGRLDHPNVVRAFDADQIGGTLYIVMEYVPGQSLGQKLRAEGPMPPLDVARWGAQAARGLAHAHEQAIVHRDIKPSNLLLAENGQVKVLDLGLGALMEADDQATFATADGIAVGTIDYMSPEQAMGKDVDGRSDIYSLGCAMYHIITGRLPFPGTTPVDRLGRRISGRPVPILEVRPDVPAELARVLGRMLAARTSERYQKADEVADALEAVVNPKPATPRRSMPPSTASNDTAPMAPAAPISVPASSQEQAVPTSIPYPGWFRPLADLAVSAPTAAMLILLAALLFSFGAGFAIAALALK